MNMLPRTTLVAIVALTALLFVTSRSFALELIEHVNRDRARVLGLQLHSAEVTDGTVLIQMEIPARGELKDYRRVELRLHEGNKVLLSSVLKEEQIKPEHVRVSFYADPSILSQATLKIVTDDLDGRIGHELKVKDFMDRTLEKAPSKTK